MDYNAVHHKPNHERQGGLHAYFDSLKVSIFKHSKNTTIVHVQSHNVAVSTCMMLGCVAYKIKSKFILLPLSMNKQAPE